MKLLLGEKIAEKILGQIKKEIVTRKIKPSLAIILVGESKVGRIYIKKKEKACQEVGIKIKKYFLPITTGQTKLLDLIAQLNKNPEITGILVQLPLPKNYDTNTILNAVDPKKDVDGLGEKTEVTPPTAQAIISLLKYYKIPVRGRTVCLVGYGRLVGKPLEPLLKNGGAELTICRSQTPDLKKKILRSDIVISATGSAGLIRKGMIKKGAVIIDAGTAMEKGKIRGDVDFTSARNKAAYLTPPKGGVGPLTIAKLLENVIKLTRRL